jgi:FkbM family methyltransferase
MPMLAQVPFNEKFSKSNGSYRKFINLLDRKATAVQRQIRRGGLGSYEPNLQAALFALAERSSSRFVFYDVGAHIGIYSVLMSILMRHRNLSVHAFEPTPKTAAINRSIRDVNNLSYQVNQIALGSKSGAVDLFISSIAETSNSLNIKFRDSVDRVTVPLSTIDDYVESGSPWPNLIKVDVETLESEVLLGARKTIAKFRPCITCEFLPRPEVKDSIGEVLSWMKFYNYKFYRVSTGNLFDEFDVYGALDAFDSKRRDWILTSLPLDHSFYKSLNYWRSGIAECNSNSNIFYNSGEIDAAKLLEFW